MEATMGERHSGVWGISRQTFAISVIAILPLFTIAMTEPPRDYTCCTLLTIFSYRESLGAIITVGISESINAIGPCFISAAG